jgi:ribosomal protein S27E
MTTRSSDSFEIDVKCPWCSHQAKKRVGWIRSHCQMECLNCGGIVDIESKNFMPTGVAPPQK